MIRPLALLAFLTLEIKGCSSGDKDPTATTPIATPAISPAPPAALVDGQRIAAADAEPGNWLSHGRTYDEQRYSPLTLINADNVGQLGLAWHVDLDSKQALEATPLVIDGVLYTSTLWNVILAVDAATGKELWRYDPLPRRDWTRYMCCGPVNRGLAAWGNMIYEGAIDGRLIAV